MPSLWKEVESIYGRIREYKHCDYTIFDKNCEVNDWIITLCGQFTINDNC